MKINLNDIKFKCPHCGFINTYKLYTVISFRTTELVCCDDENGGCGTQIVMQTELSINAKTTGLKIEGIEPPKELIASFEPKS